MVKLKTKAVLSPRCNLYLSMDRFINVLHTTSTHVKAYFNAMLNERNWPSKANSKNNYHKDPLQWRHNGHDGVSNHRLTIVYSTVYSDADQRKHQSSASLVFVRGIHRGPMNSPHKWPVTRKMFPFDYVIMQCWVHCCRNVFILTLWNLSNYTADISMWNSFPCLTDILLSFKKLIVVML